MKKVINSYNTNGRFSSPEYIKWRLVSGPCDPKHGIPFVNRFNPCNSIHVFREESTEAFHFGLKKVMSESVTLFFECREAINTVEEMVQIVRDYILLRKEDADKGAPSFNEKQFDCFIKGNPSDELFIQAADYIKSKTA